MPDPAFDKPFVVDEIDGEVVITGPGNLNGAFTPEAADQAADTLKAVAGRARARRADGSQD